MYLDVSGLPANKESDKEVWMDGDDMDLFDGGCTLSASGSVIVAATGGSEICEVGL